MRKAWVNSKKCDINACSIRAEYIMPGDTKRPTFASQCKALTKARKDFKELGHVHVHVLQETMGTPGDMEKDTRHFTPSIER